MAKSNVPANRTKEAMKMNIPQSFVTALQVPQTLEGGFGISSPYVQFVHHAAKNYSKLQKQIKGLGDDTIALVFPGEKPAIKLDPYKFSLVQLYQYWATMDNTGNPTKVWWKSEDAPKDAEDMIDTVVVVYTETDAVLARCLFKSVKGKAIRAGHVALIETQEEPAEFAKRGAEFASAQDIVPQPYLRSYVEVEQTRRISKRNGLPYYVASGTVHATTNTEWTMIGKMFNDENFEKDMAAVMGDYDSRNKFLQTLNK